MGSTSEGIFSS